MTVWNVIVGYSHHALIAACMEHVATPKLTHERMMLESSLADGALVIGSFIPGEICGPEANLRS